MPAPTGAQTTLWYRWENDGFANEPDTTDNDEKPFGANATLDTAEGSNEALRVLEPQTSSAVDIIKTVFAGSFTVSFELTNPWWLGGILGEPDSADGTHTYDEVGGFPMRIYQGNSAAGYTRELYGCVLSEVTITVATPEVVQVNLTGAYAGEEATTGEPVTQPSITYPPMRFSDARLEVDGTEAGLVQNLELSINVNANMVNALGSDESVSYWLGETVPTLSFGQVRADDTETLEDFYGGSASGDNDPDKAPCTVEFDSSIADNELEFALDMTFPESYSTSSAEDVTALTTEDVNRAITTVSATATNDTDVAP